MKQTAFSIWTWFWMWIVLHVAPCAAQVEAASTAPILLTEFQASNQRTFRDEANRMEDWIEIQNVSTETVNLKGWALGDKATGTRRWLFPETNMPSGAVWVIWASGRNQARAGAALHTEFKLSADGDYLALYRPDGTRATAFSPRYPRQFPDESFGFLPGLAEPVTFTAPTPGRPNHTTTNLPGPRIDSVTHRLIQDSGLEFCEVQSRVAMVLAPVHQVQLAWRVHFDKETNQPMTEVSPGLWSARIPVPPEARNWLVRWRVLATDRSNHVSRSPSATNPRASSRHHGTLLHPAKVDSQLPVFRLFLAPSQLRRADSDQGARGCLVFNDEFYDNILIKVRGNTTAGFPKKSHRLEFPHDHPFKHPHSPLPTRATSIMAEYGDPTYLRQYLSFWMQRLAGSAAPYHEPVRVDLNGQFWQLAMHSEVLGEEILARNQLDPNGALYKAVGTVEQGFYSTGGAEKKTRREEGDQDYHYLAYGLSEENPLSLRQNTLFNQMHMPSVLNYLAAARLTQEDDDIWANMSLYRDSDGTGEWRPIPFDMNVSWGFSFAWGGVIANHDNGRSHPFFGISNLGQNQGFNRLYDAVIRSPESRAMLLRRMRTLMDSYWQPPGTPLEKRIIENQIQSVTNRIWKEAILDREKWGFGWNAPDGANPHTALSLSVQQLIEEFIEPRRTHFFKTHLASGGARPVGIAAHRSAGIPESQSPQVQIRIANWNTSSTQASLGFIELTNANPVAVDLSGWKIAGDARFVFEPGTVMPPSGQLRVARKLTALRPPGPWTNGHYGVLLVGNYRDREKERRGGGGAESGSKTIQLKNPSDTVVSQWPASPSR